MFTVIYILVGCVAGAALWYGARSYFKYRTWALLLTSSTLIFLWFDNFAIAFGKYLGQGDFLYGLTYVRYGWHWLTLPLWIIAAGSIARAAGFAWAQNKLVMAAFCLVATYFIATEVPLLFSVEFYPACFADTVRYVTKVSALDACNPADIGKGFNMPPIAPITTIVVLIVLGILLWIRHGWKWLAIGSGTMFVLAAIPQSLVGPLASNIGEPINAFALIATAVRFARPVPVGTRLAKA
jgi:hypothetical protein